MARTRMITRSICFQETHVMTLDIATAQPQVKLYITPSPEPLTIEELKRRYDTETVKLVAIVDNTSTQQVYGMTEVEFINRAELIPR